MFMQRAIVMASATLLRSIATRSTSSIPMRFTRLATQKKRPLITTEGIPDYYSYKNAKETKELKPARRTTMSPIIK